MPILWLKQEFYGLPKVANNTTKECWQFCYFILTRIGLISPIDSVNFKIDQNGWVGSWFWHLSSCFEARRLRNLPWLGQVGQRPSWLKHQMVLFLFLKKCPKAWVGSLEFSLFPRTSIERICLWHYPFPWPQQSIFLWAKCVSGNWFQDYSTHMAVEQFRTMLTASLDNPRCGEASGALVRREPRWAGGAGGQERVSTVLTRAWSIRLTGADKMVQDRGLPRFLENQREEGLRDECDPEGWRNLLKATQLERGRARDRTFNFRLCVNLSC